ncbi:DUF3613 domain-containing protein [Pseudomonas sp. MAFF212428]|uniref:DUF3613 domain-containing protein n=1 Tax=Pseudomonas brassicae TaxID=2708063 RepID=A0A6B3NUT3_9PSED|nr:DUF3613 domain-containing protein [Pseudomonas brassicae]NER61721.1 DUF3613 domain-containing protein [Pseudomonas brassicae]NER63114.1 DUF3613 domain-containing protein [Pseudomonas brassicae]
MKTAVMMLMVVLPGWVQAVEPGPSSRAQGATEAWLQVQASGQQASKTPQTATPKEREQSMQRWLDSYKYVIPDFFRWEKTSSSDK